MSMKTFFQKFWVIGTIIIICILFVFASWSGFHYMYDIDEQYHIQTAYQMLSGLVPYRDFFLPYTSLFHWILVPFIYIFGTTFTTLRVLRIVMIIFFGIRIVVFGKVVQKAFDTKIALLSIILVLCDPFTVFSGMQIRPDTVMITFFSVGILYWYYGLQTNKPRHLFFSGLFLMLSVLILLKSLPVLLVFSALLLYFALVKGNIRYLPPYILGVTVAGSILFLPSFFQGTIGEMSKQAFHDVMLVLNALKFPAFVGDLFNPINFNLFTTPGKSIHWVYIWVLIGLGVSGVFVTLNYFASKKLSEFHHSPKQLLKLGLLLTLLSQWVFLFTSSSVFIQYYVPVTMSMAVFGGVSLFDIFDHIYSKPVRIMYGLACGGMLVFLGIKTVQADIVRATLTGSEFISKTEKRWDIVPKDKAVFPSMLFRPLIHPLGANGYYELPKEILSQYPPLDTIVTVRKVPFLFYEHFKAFSPSVLEYIKSHYKPTVNDFTLYQRID
jgi:hypothetical protein